MKYTVGVLVKKYMYYFRLTARSYYRYPQSNVADNGDGSGKLKENIDMVSVFYQLYESENKWEEY